MCIRDSFGTCYVVARANSLQQKMPGGLMLSFAMHIVYVFRDCVAANFCAAPLKWLFHLWHFQYWLFYIILLRSGCRKNFWQTVSTKARCWHSTGDVKFLTFWVLFVPAFVAEWLTHLAAMCSRAWRAQWPGFNSARARPSTKELFLMIPMHMMNRELIPGR